MRSRGGRGPPPLGDDPRIKQPSRKLTPENMPKSRLLQAAPSALPCEANETFAWHFRRFAADAGRQSLLDAAETAMDPGELVQFAEARFNGLIYGFEASFFDSWDAVGAPFREAAKSSIHAGRRL
jgi:hypothetical protein